MGLRSARHCSSVAIKALENNTFSSQTLQQYHALWSKDIGRELRMGMKFRKVFTRLSDKQLDKYIQKLNTKKIIEAINTYGDIDYPSKLAFPLLKASPSLIKALLPFNRF